MPRPRQRVTELGGRQRAILDFILSNVEEHGYPPSVREIADAVGLASPSTVHTHLTALQRKGYLTRDPSKPRAIKVSYAREVGPTVDSPATKHVPLIGRVAAGNPTLAVEDVEELFALPASLVGQGPSFMLRISGDSMIEAGINDGDLVVVMKQDSARNGDIVIAMFDDEATCKTFVSNETGTFLKPENSNYPPIEITSETRIIGRVVALMRSY